MESAAGVALYEEEALALASWALASCEEAAALVLAWAEACEVAALASACAEACEKEALASWALAFACEEEVVFAASWVAAAAACEEGQAVHLKEEAGLGVAV